MPDLIKLNINVTKFDKNLFFKGNKGLYADMTLVPLRDGPDQYGNDYLVTQNVSKEARERGEKGPIVGNAKVIRRHNDYGSQPDRERQHHQQQKQNGYQPDDDDDGAPFPF